MSNLWSITLDCYEIPRSDYFSPKNSTLRWTRRIFIVETADISFFDDAVRQARECAKRSGAQGAIELFHARTIDLPFEVLPP